MRINRPVALIIKVLCIFVLLGSVVSTGLSASGDRRVENKGGVAPQFWVWADSQVGEFAPQRTSSEGLLQASPQSANFQVTYQGDWPAEARQALEYAQGIWESNLSSPVIIDVVATWEDLGNLSILGGARAADAWTDFDNAPSEKTWYPNALANKLAGEDLDPSKPDIYITFNSTFPSWYFGVDGQPGLNLYDFVTVALHEIAHGLGFSGSMFVGSFYCVESNYGCWGFGARDLYPFVYDRFVVNSSGSSLIDTAIFLNPSLSLASELQGNNLFFSGTHARLANGGVNPKLFAPSEWQQGSSYAHLDEVFNGTSDALMTWSLSQQEVQHAPGPILKGILQDIGWTITAFSVIQDKFIFIPNIRKDPSPPASAPLP